MPSPTTHRLPMAMALCALLVTDLGCERLQSLLPGASPAPSNPSVPIVGSPAPGSAGTAAAVAASAWSVTISRDAAQVVGFTLPPVVGAEQVAVFVFAAGATTPAWTWVGPPGRVRYGTPQDVDAQLVEVLGDTTRARSPAPDSYAAVAFDAQGGVVATIPRRPL